MSVSGELLCSFELLKPLDSSALKSHIKKGRNKRNSILNSPVSFSGDQVKRSSTTFADVGFLLGINSLQLSRHKASRNLGRGETLIFHRRKIKNIECEQLGLGVAYFRVISNCRPPNILNSTGDTRK